MDEWIMIKIKYNKMIKKEKKSTVLLWDTVQFLDTCNICCFQSPLINVAKPRITSKKIQYSFLQIFPNLFFTEPKKGFFNILTSFCAC